MIEKQAGRNMENEMQLGYCNCFQWFKLNGRCSRGPWEIFVGLLSVHKLRYRRHNPKPLGFRVQSLEPLSLVEVVMGELTYHSPYRPYHHKLPNPNPRTHAQKT